MTQTALARPAQRAREPQALPPQKARARIARRRRVGLYAVAGGLWTSGALWLVLHYFLQGAGKFGPVTNPAEPWMLRLHGAFAFGALWFFGLIWGAHIAHAWALRQKRVSGSILTGTVLFLGLTGYLLYYLGDDGLRDWTAIAHWGVGLAALGAFLAHRLLKRAGR